jgi:hypothetical protein
LGHVVQHALTTLGLLRKKVLVSFLDSSRISHDRLPTELEGDEMPNLLFLNLDGASTLLRYHLGHLQNLASRNILKRVYLDEFQQILVEYGFRSSYQSLQQLGRVGVPVMCLSGSLPCTMAMSLMSYCGLSASSVERSHDIVKPTDPIGDGYSFDVTIVDDVSISVIDYVSRCRVGACHVLCSSIALVESITVGLSKDLRVVSITGASPYQEQVTCAKAWYKGGCDVLVSTVVALVGNENKLCKTIVVAGFLFNVSSLVQAIGRLRPEQRGPTSKVHVFRYPIRSQHRLDAKLQSQQLFSEIVAAGCLTNDSRQLFESLFTPVGLQQVLSLKEGCYLQHLSNLYGFVRLPCERCGLCLDSNRVDSRTTNCLLPSSTISRVRPDSIPSKELEVANGPSSSDLAISMKRAPVNGIRDSVPSKRQCTTMDKVLVDKEVREQESRITKVLCRKAKWVFIELQYRCVACGKTICNGECAAGCFRCGSRHHRSNVCTYDANRLSKLLSNKGVCFGCFDTSQHLMESHDMKSCPLKRRLKRLVFLDHQRHGNDFGEYLRNLYSSEMSFVRMVASFSDKTSLGR